ncbi:hypothetical protein JK359_23930 [Streptomyces actinomycinicus]|uniref:Uncharacterized protein n=1 Tax=Streptomyces actinomycinicus TaxID=1695166 RepID=A0A937JMR5_9ACTN|nr:hypothetical protein [Streptomyces actinomycinicus]MBL1084984.1 hypothetical protein [Streptomyces actinomycinicus]
MTVAWRWHRQRTEGPGSGDAPTAAPSREDGWESWLRRSPAGAELRQWWRDEGNRNLARVGPERYREHLAELLSRASPRDVAAMGIGCTRRADRPCRDPRTCGQDPPAGRVGPIRNRMGPLPGACAGFTDCWTAYGIDVAFTPDDAHRAVHVLHPSGRCMLWVDGVRVAEGAALEHSGYWADERFYVVQAAGPRNHPEQHIAMGNLGWNILSLVVHDAARVTTRVLEPEATQTWTSPVLRVDGRTLCVYPDPEAGEDAPPDRVLPVEPLPSPCKGEDS